ncbi:hypothetical protein J6590_030222 [Homalodisca vitripennis]|nr:hypothetical protein J6590_030222 [Homalodisca vitripennis]
MLLTSISSLSVVSLPTMSVLRELRMPDRSFTYPTYVRDQTEKERDCGLTIVNVTGINFEIEERKEIPSVMTVMPDNNEVTHMRWLPEWPQSASIVGGGPTEWCQFGTCPRPARSQVYTSAARPAAAACVVRCSSDKRGHDHF